MVELGGALLGVAHMFRGMKHDPETGFNGDRYTHFFFAISAAHPYTLTHISSEFCFPSVGRPHDCDSVQFCSSVLRQQDPAGGGDILLFGYGVDDTDAYTITTPVATVLSMLVPVM